MNSQLQAQCAAAVEAVQETAKDYLLDTFRASLRVFQYDLKYTPPRNDHDHDLLNAVCIKLHYLLLVLVYLDQQHSFTSAMADRRFGQTIQSLRRLLTVTTSEDGRNASISDLTQISSLIDRAIFYYNNPSLRFRLSRAIAKCVRQMFAFF